jgi:hypothetical protein
MEIKVELRDWSHECSDGCCYAYGTELWVDGSMVCSDIKDNKSLIEKTLSHLGVNAKVIQTYEESYE